jgi:hypothetical protein
MGSFWGARSFFKDLETNRSGINNTDLRMHGEKGACQMLEKPALNKLKIEKMTEVFAANGWVAVQGLLSFEDVAEAKRAVAWAMQQPSEVSQWIRPRPYEWFREHPIFVKIIEHPVVIEFARAWLGPEFHLIAAQCSRNTRDAFYAPGANKLHQDTVFFPHEERRAGGVADDRYSFSAMWYMQDTPLVMGPTELVTGSQHCASEPALEGPLALPLQKGAMAAGTLLIFNHRTWHRGAPNGTETPRDLITNAYARLEIDKEQLATPQTDGTSRYVPCDALLNGNTPILRRLLGVRDSISPTR